MSGGESESIDIIKDIMKNSIDISVVGKGLQNLRAKTKNLELFKTFVNYCLIHFTTSMNWQYKVTTVVISEIFTESDEVLCILLLDYNATYYVVMHREQRKINRKETKPIYTKVEFIDKNFKGWDRRGIQMFNIIVNTKLRSE